MEYKKAFTIVELLIVMVVIGIIASVALVSYSGISSSATNATIQADLKNASTVLKLYNAEYASYPTEIDPTTNCPTKPNASTSYCIKLTSPNVISGYYGTTNTYNLKIGQTSSNTYYKITDTSSPSQLSINLAEPTDCPTGFIPVPGSITYEQPGFCVMKYEAKADDNGDGIGDTTQTTGVNTWPTNTYPISSARKLVSTPQGYPIANISQNTAKSVSDSANNTVYGCPSGCHLITESEWMTIAQNVLSVPSNWSGGAVGSGYIYNGHVNNNPATALEADADDNNGLFGIAGGTGNGAQYNNRRTLALSNGQVIWDLAGNAYEWTQGTVGPGLEPGPPSWAWREWTSVSGGSLSVNPYPSSTGIIGASLWSSANGIGQIYSNSATTYTAGIIRGGTWSRTNAYGVLHANMNYYPVNYLSGLGLRVAR